MRISELSAEISNAPAERFHSFVRQQRKPAHGRWREREREREREISQRELIRKDKTGNSLGIFGKSSGKVRCSLRSPIGDCRKQTIIDGCSDVRDMREK